jgi:hypothetical protein
LDLFPLPVVEEALEADEDHHVVAHSTLRQKALDYRTNALCDLYTTRAAATRRAFPYGLTNLEGAMLDGLTLMDVTLLDLHLALAEVTEAWLLFCAYSHRGQGPDESCHPSVQVRNLIPQRREGFDTGAAVFFPGCNS